jgi:hypothetical protein
LKCGVRYSSRAASAEEQTVEAQEATVKKPA